MKPGLFSQSSSTIPPGWTPEQFEWLSLLGVSKDKARREQLLRQGASLIMPGFVETSLATLQTTKPDEARHWLLACHGLVIVADVLHLAPLRSKTRHTASQLAYVAGQWLESARLAEEGLQIYEVEGDRRRVANQLFSAGVTLHFGKQPIDALAIFEKVQPMSEQLGDDWRVALCSIYRANAYYKVGRSGDALIYCLRALPALDAMKDHLLLSNGYVLAGLCYDDLGRFEEALEMYERAKTLFQEKGDKDGIALIYLNIGAALLDMERVSEATRAFELAKPLFSELGDSRRVALCDLNLGVILSRQGKYQEAIKTYEKAGKVFEQIGDDYNQAGIYMRMGNDYRFLKRWQESMAIYQRARDLCQAGKFERDLAECLLGMGYVQMYTRKPAAARDFFESALQILEKHRGRIPDPEIASETFYRFETLVPALVSANIQSGQLERAFEAAQRGKGTILRQTLLTETISFSEFTTEESLRLERLRMEYEVARHTLQETANSTSGYVQRLRAYERARTELDSYETGLRAKYPRWRNEAALPATAREIARSLGQDKAILEIFVDYRQTTLLLLTARSGKPVFHSHSVPIMRSELNELIRGHWQALRENRTQQARKASCSLYNLLVKPLESYFKGVSELIICPDQVTHAIAFSALINKKGEYLIEQFPISCAPSASAWHACKTIADRHRTQKQNTPLITALSDFGASSGTIAAIAPAQIRRGNLLNNLPYTRTEAKQIAQVFKGKAKVLLNEQATTAAVRRNAAQASLLHFATHAFSNGASPMMSALALHPADERDPGLLYARDIGEMRLKANLVVLSACSTYGGRYASGEGLMGLAWAFMVAGCSSTIATLWEIHDKASLFWVETFYKQLTAGKSKAESVRQASLRLLRAKDTPHSFTSPHYWASWTLIGDGS
jgi:CHAT domain-containing protein/Tfp pilus assembly protein PilF